MNKNVKILFTENPEILRILKKFSDNPETSFSPTKIHSIITQLTIAISQNHIK